MNALFTPNVAACQWPFPTLPYFPVTSFFAFAGIFVANKEALSENRASHSEDFDDKCVSES